MNHTFLCPKTDRRVRMAVALLSLAGASCSSKTIRESGGAESASGAGGTTGAGGSSATAGATMASASSVGGANTGVPTTMGTAVTAVAASSAGGSSAAGVTNVTGGMGGSDGLVTGGMGGASTEGGTTTATSGAATPSAGCGSEPPASGRFDIDVDGMTREYILRVPDSYDSSRPYPLVFAWHPWGGSADQVASGFGGSGYHGLESVAGDAAIMVAGEGLDFGGNGLGWGNEGGQDVAFMRAMLARFNSELCVDESRVFSTGFSFGGMMSFALGCGAADVVRAVAPMAGNTGVAGCEGGDLPVALMGFHGTDDQVVDIDGGRTGRDILAGRNGCSETTTTLETSWCDVAGSDLQPCTCVSYEGCADGYPVTWCEFTGPHTPAPNAGETLWAFFSQF